MSTPRAIDWKKIQRLAHARFGITQFRPGQRALLEAVLAGRDVLGILPTGGGKSLAFQLPALILPHATVVVSPLIALMEDQEERAHQAQVPVVKVDSTLTSSEERDAEAEIVEGQARIIYVTPERLENAEYVALIAHAGVSRLVVDEAHCVSQWGHDFRPAYLGLRHVLHRLGRPPVLALTATAAPQVASDILDQLDIRDAQVINTGAKRENLIFEVRRTPTEAAKKQALLELLQKIEGPAIVYVATVRSADEIWSWLRGHDVQATRYHGELSAGARKEAQNAFMEGGCRVVVATKAFGLGIDKPDIRLVAHYQFPDSPETYYQEAGRAGRDGKPAHAVLLYRLEDRRIQSYFLGGKYPRYEDARKIYTALQAMTKANARGRTTIRELAQRSLLSERRTKVLAAQLDKSGILVRRGRSLYPQRTFSNTQELDQFLCAYEHRYAAERARLDAIMRYAQSTLCRMQYLRTYLGDITEEVCRRCDNCRRPSVRLRTPAPRRRQAPQTVPAQFHKGQRVWHRRFGEGETLAVAGQYVTVDFPRVGVKRVLASYLHSEPVHSRAV